ncbi:beta-ketoacyl-ACP synthase III [Desulfovibrio litoralis]|uniref:Beta-ketoacyl-[acyl-carrier-protein] synthase III n=1 Tax=Desulfovibrio litoralis DSM 11393 TaxID=1121455 RepID=A0A1M7SCX4_9BACT|nr:beta-ketoacyl-ACP synthase III [Desulfovibrio litoralis]SHN56319.1 3-oxoacyl-[acyl-carrier-protein] synthase III [Desulfovibrio litoralis DSM 11393]
MNFSAQLRGVGAGIPQKVITNKDLEKIVDTTDEWIYTRTGIKERRVIDQELGTDLAVTAALQALNDAGIKAEQLTHIICATCTPDTYCPNNACIIAQKLNIKGQTALDINAGCSGFIYGLELVNALVSTNPNAVVLLVAVEILSLRSNWEDRTTCVLFGDGSGAGVFTHKDSKIGEKKGFANLIGLKLNSDGDLGQLLTIKGGGSAYPYKLNDKVGKEYFLEMEGREVFKHAVRSMTSICEELLTQMNLTGNDIDLFISHQANMRIIEAVGKQMNFSQEKIFSNVEKYGNTSAASIPIALKEAKEKKLIKENQKILLTTFGAGFTWGTALFQTIKN